MTLSEYSQLKQQVLLDVSKSDNHAYLLDKLKQYYKDDIDSDRRFEKIFTMSQLLRVLEIRDVLSEDNVAPLKEIARRLNNNELLKRINCYETNHVEREYINYYSMDNTDNTSKNDIKEVYNYAHPYANISIIKKNRINNQIVEGIGSFWRALGRNLKIPEGKIDDIDLNHQYVADKVLEILDIYYNQKADPQRWFFDLCNALEKARRKDISKSLQNIMAMNI
ncbi:fas-associated death domain protein-like [Danaus plexippus]|uniref:fas-associated death domain protein-like n=1 Tax=Danaus plexippus TaxID=13037 RepID=UPI002AB053F4|nr:fas-associated death domain protein-like [Danaus plexippus]XP_061378019.1 fas-associated death domain protein-like [Danaus plexippus]